MMGKIEAVSSTEQQSTSTMSTGDILNLESQTRKQLVKHPSTLRDAADNLLGRAHLPARRSNPFCNCRPVQQCSARQRGRFGTEFWSESQHHPHCQYYRSWQRSRTWTFKAQLLPFLHKTIALTLGSTYGAGSYSLAPSLRVYTTVKRSKSYLFKLFDEFPGRCARRRYHLDYSYDEMNLFETSDCLSYFTYDWDLELTKTHLEDLYHGLRDGLSQGIATGSDKDEIGNTILHVKNSLALWDLTD